MKNKKVMLLLTALFAVLTVKPSEDRPGVVRRTVRGSGEVVGDTVKGSGEVVGGAVKGSGEVVGGFFGGLFGGGKSRKEEKEMEKEEMQNPKDKKACTSCRYYDGATE